MDHFKASCYYFTVNFSTIHSFIKTQPKSFVYKTDTTRLAWQSKLSSLLLGIKENGFMY